MKRRELIFMLAGLGLMATTAGGLVHLRVNQRLGAPGLKTTPIEGSPRMRIELPLSVPGYEAREEEMPQLVVDALPADTSLAQAAYRDSDGFEVQVMVVMMGSDRTSIHRPEICLTGGGWAIDAARSQRTTVRFVNPETLDLPVKKLIASRTFEANDRTTTWSGVFVYWFVAENAVTAQHGERMLWMAKHLVRTGELQRWAYIAYFAPCPPGTEEEAFRRIQKLMRLTVPQFQLAWPGGTV